MAATKTIVGETLEVRFVIIMPIERLRLFRHTEIHQSVRIPAGFIAPQVGRAL